MKVRCPHCGSSADSVSSFAFSAMRHEFTFRCISNRCRQTFTGKIELNTNLPKGLSPLAMPLSAPSVHLLRDQNSTLTDC